VKVVPVVTGISDGQVLGGEGEAGASLVAKVGVMAVKKVVIVVLFVLAVTLRRSSINTKKSLK
jgi:hypothetical protein